MKDVKRKMLRRAIPMGRRWRREVVMGVEGWRRENWRRARRGLRRRRVWSFERVLCRGGGGELGTGCVIRGGVQRWDGSTYGEETAEEGNEC
jgi:hypothetical protein